MCLFANVLQCEVVELFGRDLFVGCTCVIVFFSVYSMLDSLCVSKRVYALPEEVLCLCEKRVAKGCEASNKLLN